MKKFKLEYSRDGRSWVPLATKVGDAAMIFDVVDVRNVPETGRHVNKYKFPGSTSSLGLGPFEARYVRVYLADSATWGYSSIQCEFYGPRCQAAGLVPVGIASDAIPDTAMTQNEEYTGKRGEYEGPSKGRLNSPLVFGANYKGYSDSPAGNGFREQLWLQVNLGRTVTIGAVATQGATRRWVTQYKLGGSIDGESFSMTTELLQGNSDEETVVKHYVTPFAALHVRLYPWAGNDQVGGPQVISFRMELYAVATDFEWLDSDGSPRLRDHTSQGAIGSDAFCNLTMLDLAPAFQSWTEGMHGDGGIYESDAWHTHLGSTGSETMDATNFSAQAVEDLLLPGAAQYKVTAYQRSTTKFVGIMGKRLVCFDSGTEEKCCVSKEASLQGRGPWHRQAAEIKMS